VVCLGCFHLHREGIQMTLTIHNLVYNFDGGSLSTTYGLSTLLPLRLPRTPDTHRASAVYTS
jgi:hypothetical protein